MYSMHFSMTASYSGTVKFDWVSLPAGSVGVASSSGGISSGRERTIHHALDLGGGRVVGRGDVAIIQPGVAHHLDVVAQVVEHEQRVGEHEDRLGQALGVGLRHGHARLKVVHGVVGDVAHAAPMERWQTLHGNQPEGVHFTLHQGQRVHRARGLVGAGAEHVVRLGADETVAANAFAAGHRLQQEGVGRTRHLQVG